MLDAVLSLTPTSWGKSMRIVYGVQSTGKGHLSRFLGLLPLFRRDGHELLVLITGRWDPPAYFLGAISGTPYHRFSGLSMVPDGIGGISKRGTVRAFATRWPGLFHAFRKAHRLISAFDPDLIVSDFDPVTGSPFVAPTVPKVGIGNYFTPARPDIDHPAGFRRERFNARVVDKLVTSGLDARLGCHFYPIDDRCLPPILRPELLAVEAENRGHILVYHAFPGLLAPVVAYAQRHPSTPVILYGQRARPRGLPTNIHVALDADRFLVDLATCDGYIGTAGFQSIVEAFYLGKRLAVQPIAGHYEQTWNAFELERRGMGRWCRGDLDEALDQALDAELHARLASWYRGGAQEHYTEILRRADR